MSRQIEIGVLGFGYWGPNLVRNFAALDNCAVRWICDQSEERVEEAARRFPNTRTTRNWDEVIQDPEIEAVAIVTPTAHHYDMAMAAMRAGKHVFVEKPLATKLEEGIEMVQYSQEHGLTLMVGHTFVYSAPVRKVKEIIKSGEIGQVLNIDAQRLNLGLFQQDINVVWDLAPHDISILLYLLEEFPTAVNCQGKVCFVEGIEDVATMSLYFPSGAFATIHLSWLNPDKTRLIKIVGTRKMISYDDTMPLEKIKVFDKRIEPSPYYDGLGEFQFAYHYGDIHVPYFKQKEPLQVETNHFLDCIRNGIRCESSGYDGLRVLQVLDAATRSLRNNSVLVGMEPLPMDVVPKSKAQAV